LQRFERRVKLYVRWNIPPCAQDGKNLMQVMDFLEGLFWLKVCQGICGYNLGPLRYGYP
jgi:hypothetical protein